MSAKRRSGGNGRRSRQRRRGGGERTRADSRLLNLTANVRRLRDFPDDLLVSPGPTSSGTMQRQFNFMPDLRAWRIQIRSRAQAKCISQRSLVGGGDGGREGEDERRVATLKPFAGTIPHVSFGNGTTAVCCALALPVSPSAALSLPAPLLGAPHITCPASRSFHVARAGERTRDAISN